MESSIPKERPVFEDTIRGGGMWSYVIKRGHTLRVTDLEGGANVALLMYNADQPLERYNMPDTLKAQHTAHLTKGFVLYSDMGRVLFSITEDSCGWHDPVGGVSNAEIVQEKYGAAPYQTHRNEFHRNGRDNFLIELEKWGLGKRDIVPNLNLFTKLASDEDGNLSFVEGNSKAGDFIDLRAEMNVLVVLNTCQHPLDPATEYAPKPVKLSVWKSDPPGPDDYCRNFRPENQRGFINTEKLFLQD